MQPDPNNTPNWPPYPPPVQPGQGVITQPDKPCPPERFDTLSRRQLTEINKGLANVDAAVRACDEAERCGVSCEDRRAELETIRQQLNQFKATYFPGNR